MGEVYRAHDAALGRDIAVKVLPADQLRDPARARLLREARSAAALNHPHICTIYEVGETGEQTYIAMELIEGTTLSDRIQSGSLKEEQVVRYGAQLADALAHAHERGIVHHDLKSSNVMIAADDRLKVLDFGLAKKTHSGVEPGATTEVQTTTLTRPGTVIGTLAYMAPEQLRGDRGDMRSDIWAFGVILCEMIAGERPFLARTQNELVAAILNSRPSLSAKFRPQMRQVVERCLAKDPARRFQNASEIRSALELPRRWTLTTRDWIATATVAAIIAISATVPLWKDRIGGSKPKVQSLAVLPLENLSGDAAQEYFADGMTEALIADLGRTGGVSRVIARTSVMRYKGSKIPPADIAKQLSVDALVTGSVVRSGDRVRVTAELVNPSTGDQLWSGRYERDLRDVLALQSELTGAILVGIHGALTADQKARLAESPPVNPAAYEDYLRGRFYWYRLTLQDMATARTYFERALKEDPDYGLASLGLADAIATPAHAGFMPTTDVFPQGKALIVRTLQKQPELPEAHDLMARILFAWDWNWPAAEREFKRSIELNPNYPDGRTVYSQFLQSSGRIDESLAQARRAAEIDPQNPFFREQVALALEAAGRYDEAVGEFRKLFAVNPAASFTHSELADILFLQRRYEDAWREDLLGFDRQDVADAATRAYRSGGYASAMQAAAETFAAARREQFAGAITLARLYVHAGMPDKVFEWLRVAAEERDTRMCYVIGDPLYANIRRDPRFGQILAIVRAKEASSSR